MDKEQPILVLVHRVPNAFYHLLEVKLIEVEATGSELLVLEWRLVSQGKKNFGLDMCLTLKVLGCKVGPFFWVITFYFQLQ